MQGSIFVVFIVEVREADVFGRCGGGWSVVPPPEKEVAQTSCKDENDDTGDGCPSNDTNSYGF